MISQLSVLQSDESLSKPLVFWWKTFPSFCSQELNIFSAVLYGNKYLCDCLDGIHVLVHFGSDELQ